MKFIIIIFLLNVFPVCYGQTQKIEQAALQFELPNDKWSLLKTQEANSKFIYFYKREPITDKNGNQVVPNISFIVEDVSDSIDVVTFSAFKRLKTPFDVIEVFSAGSNDKRINYGAAVCYKGKYKENEFEHTVYVIHLIKNKKGVQIFFDITSDLFPDYEKEFLITLKSLQ